MESIYAALLLHKAGKKVTEDAVDKVLKAAGAKVDSSDITKLIAGLKEADIDEIISSAAVAPVMAASVSTAPVVAEVKELKKEKEEEEEEEEPTGIGSLF
jgi:large subunit ribosomal protein L12